MIILVRNEDYEYYRLSTSTGEWTGWLSSIEEAAKAPYRLKDDTKDAKANYALYQWDHITGQHRKFDKLFLVKVLQYDSPIWDI